jgi:hypothetical protein
VTSGTSPHAETKFRRPRHGSLCSLFCRQALRACANLFAPVCLIPPVSNEPQARLILSGGPRPTSSLASTTHGSMSVWTKTRPNDQSCLWGGAFPRTFGASLVRRLR